MADTAMKGVFVQCQNSMQSHGKLLKMLHKIYEKKEFTEFWKDFQHLMKYSLIIYQREPAVERTIDFISKFVTYVTPSPNNEGSQDDSTLDEISQNKLLQFMFDYLLQSHNACEKAVRFRCCQMINKILGTLGEDAQIDDDLYDRIYESMLERLRDKQPVVRMHAVMALARLQDPRDENCPVIKAYLFLVSSDPNYEVRRVVLSNIAPSTKTLPAIIQRTRDVKDSVRKMAYTVLGEKVHIKALSIANRVRLLQDGLTDRSEMVKSACSTKLLQTWLRTFGGNVLDLLGSLDVENSTETCELALETLFKGASLSEMVERFDLLDDKILIPLEKLNSESSMYWQTLCKYIHNLGHESDEYLDKVLPNCVEFCHYIQSFVETLKDLDDIDAQLEKEFVIQQLLTMTKYMELADQASRRAVEKLLHDMLIADHVGHSLVSHIVPRLCEIKDNSDSMVVTLAETVSEIREPITTVERGPTQEEKRQNDIKIASIRVKLNQHKEELDEAVKNQDFEKAAEIKAAISECETERNALLEVGEPHVEEVRTEKTDVSTILKCQAIVAEMLEVLPLKSLNPTLQMLVESLILPGIQNEDSRVRKLAVQALGLCCVLSKDLVLQYLPLFMQASQIDAEIVRTTSLRVIFDMLHMHGLEAIQRNKDGEDNDANTSGEGFDISRRSSVSERQEDDRNDTASKLMVFLCGFLDGESSELRTVAAEGLAKLLLSGRVVSSKILSHLILLWYNPTTEDDSHLRHCLGTFFPIFAFAGRSNQEVVEDAFLPTLKTLLNAPTSSPLAEVNVENVAELLVQLSNARLLMENQSNPEAVKDNPLHDNLAVKVCNEILSNPDSFNLKLWVKILKQIELSENNDVVFKELAVLADQLIEVVKEKKCQKTLEKFRDSVKEKVPETPTEENQNQNAMEVEQPEPVPEEAPQGDTTQQEEPSEADRTAERSAFNDTALQLEGSLFLQEAKTLRRAQSKISTSSTPPRATMGPPDKGLIQSPVAVLFSTKSTDRQALEKSRTKWQDQVLAELVEEGEGGAPETNDGEKSSDTAEISNSPQKDESGKKDSSSSEEFTI
ncbi:hypothetical protein FSP39_006096 [Pinctada imbricata]|uniref:UVR domain-containing protein n=1 Tax=Pinctada imbricata TaxID=66713 RepID=A0AA88Y899_PINIB|nr:hypothetical protein FSP39_006096 [Pinctada imbricata]